MDDRANAPADARDAGHRPADRRGMDADASSTAPRAASAGASTAAARSATDAIYLARLDRLQRTVERVRSLAEKIHLRAGQPGSFHVEDSVASSGAAPAVLAEIGGDATELKALAEELVLLGYTFREVRLEPSFRFLATWANRLRSPRGAPVRLQANAEGLQLDHRLAPVLRERLQQLMQLLLELDCSQSESGMDFRLTAKAEGRSLRIELQAGGLGLQTAEVMQDARRGGLRIDRPDSFLRQPGRLLFHRAFAAGRGLPADWSRRLSILRDLLRRDRGDLVVRESDGGAFIFSLRLPLVADLAALLVVRSGDRSFALPIESTFSTRVIAPQEWAVRDGVLWLETPVPPSEPGFDLPMLPDHGPAPAATLTQLLWVAEGGLCPVGERPDALAPVVLLEDENGLGAVLVDEIVGERQILLHHPRQVLPRVRHLCGSVLLPSGEVCVVLHPWDLLQTLRALAG